MSSFVSLRAAKVSKQSKSFVKPSPDVADPCHTPIHPQPQLNDELYGTLPSSLDIRTAPNDGRGIYATQPMKRGTTVLSLPPHVQALSVTSLSVHCSYCAAPSPDLKRCTRCKIVRYCGSSCQNNDWALHKRECPALTRWSSDNPKSPVPSDAVRCLARMLWAIELNGLESRFTRQLASMQSSRPVAQAATHTQLAYSLVRFMGISGPEELLKFGVQGAGGVADVVARFTTNAITLSTPTITPIGVLLSPLAALFNHSCDPSAVIVFPTLPAAADNLKLKVVCIKDVQPDEEIFTSYIDTTLPYFLRQISLLETYDFRCDCTLCSRQSTSQDAVDPREQAACPRGCGGVWRVSIEEDGAISKAASEEDKNEIKCTKCGYCIPKEKVNEVQDVVRVGGEGLKEAEKIQNEDPTRAHRLTTNLIPLLAAAGLASSSYPLLALLRLHQQFELDHLTTALSNLPGTNLNSPGTETTLSDEDKSKANEAQQVLDGAVQNQARIARGLSDIFCEGHPVRALALAELGKLLSVDEPWPPAPGSHTPAALLPASSPTPAPVNSGLSPSFPPHHASRLSLALQSLQRAQRELDISFGAGGGEVGKEVRSMAGRVEAELGVWRETRGGQR
ncbi:SET domain-containing protein [Neolentinus lepideus HHB14362 ss-1]|uniref:SET domain-containing protein n=1 Tax=Neolentinus lepideus HHB14362 ss-1 TaxID=1314782 RepID=A0A165PEE7_9AGAM|nr:SET domain-containing protein [Neolentinus lepideus HHB14362 ss-1]